MLNNAAHGATYHTQDNTTYKLVSTAYVDDINTHHTSAINNQEYLIPSMSEDFSQWKNILEASGGKLATEKCSYYAIGWIFSRGGKPEMVDFSSGNQNDLHQDFSANKIDIADHHKSLGHRMSPKDPSKAQINHMKDIEDRFVGILNQNHLTSKENEVLYRSTYTPTVRYILQGSCMNKLELQRVSRKSKQLFLQRMTYPKTIASNVVFGSTELGGLGMLELHTEQNLLNLQLLERALNDNQMAGSIIKVAISHWKWQIGTGRNPFESEYHYPHDESKWLKELRKFTIQYQVKINIGENEYPLQRDNDKYIMELAEEFGFNTFELRFLNHCRLFLNVISVSDIVNESGRGIDPSVTNFKKLSANQKSHHCVQQKPDHTKWSIWFKFLHLITKTRQNSLKRPLGPWIVDQDRIRGQFQSYRTNTKIYREREGKIHVKNINKVCRYRMGRILARYSDGNP